MKNEQALRQRSFRIVCEPERIASVEELLADEGFRFETEPFSSLCRRLVHEPFPLGASLAACFGYIYIQDRSSMLPPLALAPEKGCAVLDMAASPGSKSGFLGQLCGRDGFVLANEPNHARLETLAANLASANLLQCATCAYPGERLPLARDSWTHILLDPPCSGWGTASKKALRLWQGAKIAALTGLQRKLLARAASLLAPGGLLLYSTCTTNPAENEEQTSFAVNELGLEQVSLAPFPGFVFADTRPGSLLVDAKGSHAQGFYISLLRKPGAALAGERPAPEQLFETVERSALAGAVCDPHLLPPGETALFGDRIRFLPEASLRQIPAGFRWRGFLLGKMGAAGFNPVSRLRCLLPEWPAIRVDELVEVRRLLAGQAVCTDLKAACAGFWWRDLPLGICQIRSGRIIARFTRQGLA